jgi:iron complex outermembrane receptor protein
MFRFGLLLTSALTFTVAAHPAAAIAANQSEEPLPREVGVDGSGGEIIVTARRVEERLQDVPISITVYNQQQLDNRNIVIPTDLATYTPSLSVNQRFGPEKASFSIRGFNQDISTAPTVGVYFADVVGVRAQGPTISGNNVGAGTFMDLQNVQVLKGPQGTLFGRNTTGGAVLLVPQKPTGRLEGYAEGSLGNYDMHRLQGVINVPLSDTFKIRGGVDWNQRDGYMINHSGIGPRDYNDTNYLYARLSILAELAPNLENTTIFHYSRSNTHGYAASMSVCDPNPISFTDPTGVKNPADPRFNFVRVVTNVAGCEQVARRNARGDGPLDVDTNNPDPYLRLKQWQVINTTVWRASDALTIKNIASYGQFEERASYLINQDNFFVPALPQPFQHILLTNTPGSLPTTSQQSFTEELQFQGSAVDGRLNYVLGGYVEFSRPLNWNSNLTSVFAECSNFATLTCSAPLGFAIITQNRSKINFDNHGVFAQGTFKLSEQLSLTAGGRYTFDKIVGTTEGTRYTLAPVPGLGVIPVSLVCSDSLRHPGINILASQNYGACRTVLKETSSRPTWVVDVDYKPMSDLLLYAKWARGYRQGGLNFINVGIETWGPEKVDNYEVGLKSSFRGPVSGYFNLAGFYNKLEGQQIYGAFVARPNSGLSAGAGIVNAGRSKLYGVEVDAAATFFDSLKLDLGYTYLRTKVQAFTFPDLTNTPFAQYLPTASLGDPLALSPKHRLTATATYALPLDEAAGRLSVGATVTYTSKQVANASTPAGRLPSTTLLNLNVNWDKALGTPIDAAFFMTNVTNRIYPVNVGGNFVLDGFDNLLYAPPRMWGFRLRYNFGE